MIQIAATTADGALGAFVQVQTTAVPAAYTEIDMAADVNDDAKHPSQHRRCA